MIDTDLAQFMLDARRNRASSVGGKVAVKKTICVCTRTKRPSQAIAGRKSFCWFKITWHSSITI
jgi:hypothetical protein